MTEAEIIINGTRLNTAQAMTVRVALTQFLIDMNPVDALGADTHGRFMRDAYRQNGSAVQQIIVKRPGMGER